MLYFMYFFNVTENIDNGTAIRKTVLISLLLMKSLTFATNNSIG